MKKNDLKKKMDEPVMKINKKERPSKEAIYFKSISAYVKPEMIDGSSAYSNFYCNTAINGKDADFLSIVDPYQYIEQNLMAASPLMDDHFYNKLYLSVNKSRLEDIIMMEIDNIYYNGLYKIIKDYASTSTMYSALIGSLFNVSDLKQKIYVKLRGAFSYHSSYHSKYYGKYNTKDLVDILINILTDVANSYYDLISSLVYNRALKVIDKGVDTFHYVFFDNETFFKDNCSELSDYKFSNVQSFVMGYLLVKARQDIEKIDALLKINIGNAISKYNSLDLEDKYNKAEDDDWDDGF